MTAVGGEIPADEPGQPAAAWQSRAAWLLIAAALLGTYLPVLSKLVRDWMRNDAYSHGFLVVPIAVYFAWERRHHLRAAPAERAVTGLVLVLIAAAALAAGALGAELFVARVSLLLALAGAILFVGGWSHLRILAFPVAFLALMIPLPTIVFNQIAFPLQLLASRLGESTLQLANIPVLREGNIITLSNASLEVADACSGIRSLISLLTLSVVHAYVTERKRYVRALLVLCTVPIAILTNGLRVAAIGIAAHLGGPDLATGTFHTVSGWLVFIAALGLLIAIQRMTRLFSAYARRGGPFVTPVQQVRPC